MDAVMSHKRLTMNRKKQKDNLVTTRIELATSALLDTYDRPSWLVSGLAQDSFIFTPSDVGGRKEIEKNGFSNNLCILLHINSNQRFTSCNPVVTSQSTRTHCMLDTVFTNSNHKE
ncbi:unnamed protein product [Clonostachys rosea]|uniref:Uncharacterized protein n=1 Tax=Bionectria ochroleuca TaxID=29856 RepID=A0ABY6UIP4_BIOOC|nr:unnamed protein product [Clonostachys rosea]